MSFSAEDNPLFNPFARFGFGDVLAVKYDVAVKINPLPATSQAPSQPGSHPPLQGAITTAGQRKEQEFQGLLLKAVLPRFTSPEKIQNPKLQINFKPSNSKWRTLFDLFLNFEPWNLRFIWSLGF